MKRFNINLPDDVYEKVRTDAFNKRMSMSQLVMDSLRLQGYADEAHSTGRKLVVEPPKYITTDLELTEEEIAPKPFTPTPAQKKSYDTLIKGSVESRKHKTFFKK